jgi:TrpR family trp operon transcriptional repressor
MNEDGWQKFIQLVVAVKDPQLVEELAKLLFTSEERDAISKRVLIIEELIKGEMTQREMAENLQISIAKITRGSNALKETPKRLIQFLKKIWM